MTALRALAIAAGALLSVAGNVPYIRGIVRREADCRPRLVSWAVWAQALTVATAQELRDHQLAGGVYTAACTAGCLAVLALGWRFGDGHRPGRLDWSCLALAQVCIVLLSASVLWPGRIPLWAAVAVAVGADFLAFLPTYANGLGGHEPWLPYALFGGGSALALAVADFSVPVGVIYTAYLTAADGGMAILAVAVAARSGVAQLAEHRPVKARDSGSNPATGAQ